jgi:hypothetical protein
MLREIDKLRTQEVGASNTFMTAIEVIPVKSSKQLRTFIKVPWHVYANDPKWVPPLRLERRLHFSKMNPYFKHAKWQAWIAYRGSEPVGRISAQVDSIYRQYHGANEGQFGLLEGINDPQVFKALLSTSESWLAEHGSSHVSGPFNFSINQECGVLVDGFDTPPVMLMPHAREWYGPMIEQQGYSPAMDLLAYWINTDYKACLRRRKFKEELEIIRDIFNDAWSENWGFIPFSQEEFADLGQSLKWIIRDDFIKIAEIDGRAVSFIVVLPNLNEVLADLNGRLFPTGWLKIIRAIRNRTIRTSRVPLMGVRRQYHNSPLGMALSYLICDAARNEVMKFGITGSEMGWILENNKGMRSVLDNIGSQAYKRYRIYEKTLQ